MPKSKPHLVIGAIGIVLNGVAFGANVRALSFTTTVILLDPKSIVLRIDTTGC